MAKKATGNIAYYSNENGPAIGPYQRGTFIENGLVFKDADGTGLLSTVNDWRRIR